MRDAILIGLLYAALGAAVALLAVKYPTLIDALLWLAGALAVGCIASLFLSHSHQTTGRPFLGPALLINFGLCLIALGYVWHSSVTAPARSASNVQAVRQAFSATESIKLWPPFLGGNETLNLDNVAVLRMIE